MDRRMFLAGAAGAAMAAGGARAEEYEPVVRRGRIRQGVLRSNFGQGFAGEGPYSFEQMCAHAQRLGAEGFDLVSLDDIPMLEKYGLRALCVGGGDDINLLDGAIHPEMWDHQIPAFERRIEVLATYDVPPIFATNAGQLRGMSPEEASDNAVEFWRRIAPKLEAAGVVAVLENVNDNRPGEPRLGREDLVFGDWHWGVDVVRRVDSPNVRILCDIYHLQIMNGDITRNIERDQDLIAHFQIAGVPTRGPVSGRQEIDYRHVAEVIADFDNFTGVVSHEWLLPEDGDPIGDITRSMALIDV